MLKGSRAWKPFAIALVALMIAGAPAEAGFWRIFGAILSTAGGVALTVLQPEAAPVGAALVGLQGSLLEAESQSSNSPIVSADPKPGYAGSKQPQFCADGTMACPAAQALLRLNVQPVDLPEDATPEVATFINATNRVIEDVNLYAQHTRAGAPASVRKQDLRLISNSLSAAANAYDRLNIPLALTQADISGFQQEVAISGLPPIEKSFWESGGLTPAEVDAVAHFLATAQLELSVPSVTVSRVLHEEAAAYALASQ